MNKGLNDKYQIHFDAVTALDAVTIQGDCSLVSRMLGNLIQNSISHNPYGCHIYVAVHKAAKICSYSVTDDGAGLSKKQLEHYNAGIFSEPDYKVSGETAHGFGLRLVQQIVKAHEGSTVYESVPAGGLSVKVFLPIL